MFIGALLLVRRMRLLEMGDDSACALGVSVERSRLMLMLVAVLLTAASTAIAGPISFIALVAPHIARRLSGTARWGLTRGGAVRCSITAGRRSLRPAAVYALSTAGGRGDRQPRRDLPHRLARSGVTQEMTDSTTRLRGENLTLGYGKKIIARDLSVAIPDGHFTAIIGPNGCGKSTLLRTLSRLMSPVEGSVFLDGEQIQRFASKEVARRIGLLAQNATTPGGYYRAGAGLPRALSAPAAVYPLAQGGRRGREARDAGDGHHRAGPAKRRYPLRRTAPARVDRNGAGAGNLDHAAGRADDWLDISHQIDLLELLSELNRTQGYTPGGGVARLKPGRAATRHI